MSTALPGTTAPATAKKAAAEGSPGTVRSTGLEAEARTVTTRPSPHGSTGDVRARFGQHLLGVGPGRHRARGRRSSPCGGQAGQQDGRLHLRAGHPRRPVDALQRAALDTQRRQAAFALPADGRPHELERLGHPVHRPRERDSSPTSSVVQAKPATRPASSRMEVPEFPQSSGCAGLVQPASPAVQHEQLPSAGPLDLDTHRLYGGQRGGDVGAVGEAVDDRGALGERGEEHGPVRDRLLARRADGRPGTARRRSTTRMRGAVMTGLSTRQRYPLASTAAARRVRLVPCRRRG